MINSFEKIEKMAYVLHRQTNAENNIYAGFLHKEMQSSLCSWVLQYGGKPDNLVSLPEI